MMTRKVILCDLDNVISPFYRTFSKMIKDLAPEAKLLEVPRDVRFWDHAKNCEVPPDIANRARSQLAATEDFWATQTDTIHQTGWIKFQGTFNFHPNVDTYFCTYRMPTKGRTVVQQSVEALESMGWVHPQVLCVENKLMALAALNADYLLEDHPETLHACYEYVTQHELPCKVASIHYEYNANTPVHWRLKHIGEFVDFVLLDMYNHTQK